jgi:hypothetical protein
MHHVMQLRKIIKAKIEMPKLAIDECTKTRVTTG